MGRKIWNEFPETKPEKSGTYYVTMQYLVYDDTEYRTVYRVHWSQRHQKWNCSDGSDDVSQEFTDVIAWASTQEFPPYLGGERIGSKLEID
jgi:hypothetical protein